MSKNRKAKQRYCRLFHRDIYSPAFTSLSHYARSLLIEITAQYNGSNNGDLCCSWAVLKNRGWASRTTLDKARDELLQAGFIETTRVGGFGNGPNLYAISWEPIDEKKQGSGWPLDTKPTRVPSMAHIARKVVVNE